MKFPRAHNCFRWRSESAAHNARAARVLPTSGLLFERRARCFFMGALTPNELGCERGALRLRVELLHDSAVLRARRRGLEGHAALRQVALEGAARLRQDALVCGIKRGDASVLRVPLVARVA